MSNPNPVKEYMITLGSNVKVAVDKKSKSRVINFPFEFPDTSRGVMIICRLEDEDWVPNKTIKNITVQFV